MTYDFGLKKKVFGGLDADSVTEYITKIKAENNLLKKELVARPEASEAGGEEAEQLNAVIDELKATVADYKEQIKILNKRIAELELELASPREPAKAADSKIAIESLNFANHYFTQAVNMAGEVSSTTILKAEQAKTSLTASLSSLADFEQYISNFRKQINSVVESLDDVSDNFERIRQFESRQIDPVESSENISEKKTGERANLSLVD